MTQEELVHRLESAGLPLAYRAFRSRQEAPFLCYQYVYDVEFFADDERYYAAGHYQVELYTASKEPDIEARVEEALTGITWEKEGEFLPDQQIYVIRYDIEV